MTVATEETKNTHIFYLAVPAGKELLTQLGRTDSVMQPMKATPCTVCSDGATG